MAFVVRKLTEEEGQKYNIPLGSRYCAVDDGRGAILVNRGGGGRNESPYENCEFLWKGHSVTFKSPISNGKNQEGKRIVHWEIKHLNIPPELRRQEKELKQLIKEAIIAYGSSGLNHLPEFKYDILIVDGLEDERFKYIAE